MFRWGYFFPAGWIPARLRRLQQGREREFAASRLAFRERRTMKGRWAAPSPNIAEPSIGRFRWKGTGCYQGWMKPYRRWTSGAWMELTRILSRGRRGKPD